MQIAFGLQGSHQQGNRHSVWTQNNGNTGKLEILETIHTITAFSDALDMQRQFFLVQIRYSDWVFLTLHSQERGFWPFCSKEALN